MWILALSVLSACNGPNTPDSGDTAPDTAVEVVDFGLEERPANETCVAPDRPADPDAQIDLDRAFDAVSLGSILFATQTPADPDHWYAIVQDGRVYRWEDRDDTPAPTEILSVDVESGGERGLLGWAFDPDFGTNGFAYASFTRRDGGQLKSYVARYTSTDGGATFDAGSEAILWSYDQPAGNHNGGHIAFGPDGYLYMGMGDGGGADDQYQNGQDLDTPLGAMLRMDVSGSTATAPADNPSLGGSEPLIWAYGLRNPWRWSFDRLTGTLWVGDVGQNQWEEVSQVPKGGNMGWPEKEGTHCFDASPPCDDPDWLDPVIEYDHSSGNRSITGGYVYRGTAQPSLVGTYFYADFYTGNIWGAEWSDVAEASVSELLSSGSGILVSSFAEGLDGEVYVLDYGGGGLYRIVEAVPTTSDFPTRWSETGCADPADVTRPSSGVLPYSMNVPFWSDGADKARGFALPDGERVTVEADGDWTLPIGSAAVKHFRIDGELVESRLFVRHDDGEYAGYSYAWLPDGSDAVLLTGHEERVVGDQTWVFPSRGECLQCHTDAAGGFLGLETAQLDRQHVYDAGQAGQLETLAHIDVVDPPGDDVAPLDPTDARAYLHSNCASCHRPNGGGGGTLDLRWWLPVEDLGACNVEPDLTDMGVDGAVLLEAGAPERSLIHLRANTRETGAMPPLGSKLVDGPGMAMVEAWISGLDSCE